MESRETFEQFAEALGGRRRRAEAMARSLKGLADTEFHGREGGTDAGDGIGAFSAWTSPYPAAAVPGPRGRPTAIFGDAAALVDETIRDLGDAERELRQQNEALFEAQVHSDERSRHFQTLFELAPAAYVVTDGAGVIHELNQIASALLARPRNFVVGKPLALFVEAGAERTTFRAALSRLRSGDDGRVWPVRLSTGGRRRVDVKVSVRAARDRFGAATTLFWLLRDECTLADEDLL